MSKKLFLNYFSNNLFNWQLILSSVELVWLKWAFFSDWRINNTTGWKNSFSEAKIANKKSALPAVLAGRISGEVSYE